MPAYTTEAALFTSTNVTDTSGSTVWTNPNNLLLTTSAVATVVHTTAVSTNSHLMKLYKPIFAVPIPANATITDISFTFRAMKSNANTVQLEDFSVYPAADISSTYDKTLTTSQATYTVSGNLAFWGITNAQALEFLQGFATSRVFAFRSGKRDGSTATTTSVDYVQCTASYTTPDAINRVDGIGLADFQNVGVLTLAQLTEIDGKATRALALAA